MSFDGWVSATLQELTTKIGSGATPKGGKKAYKSEGISLVRSLNVHDRRFKIKNLAFIDDAQAALLDNVILEEDDVLLNITGASIARCCVLPSRHLPARVNQHVSIVRADQSVILPAFLCYLLTAKEYKDRLLSTGEKQGATRQALTKTLIQNFSVTFPQELAEQKRIVSILDEAFSAIAKAKENAEKNLANARELFESYLNRVFTQPGPGWQEKPLGEVVKFQGGSQPPKSTFVYQPKSGYIRLIQIRDYKSDKKITFIPEEKARRRCDETDIMIGRYGPPLFQILRGIEGAYNVALMKTIPDEDVISKDYLYYFLKNRDLFNYIDASSSRTAGQTGFKKEVLEAYPIGYPTKSSEQARIVSLLENVQAASKRLEAIYTQKLANLDELKQSLLQKAFTGQLCDRKAVSAI